MTYSVVTSRSADRDIRRLDGRIRRQVFAKILALKDNPRPQDVKLLHGPGKLYRVVSGEYRILYEINEATKVVLVFRIGHRREVYRNL